MDDIKKGFITLRGGHRIGIVGKVIIENGQVKNIKHISSLNIRVSREIKGCSKKVLPHIIKNKNQINNTIIISPPQCGKTTILRDIVRNISNGNREYGFSGVKVALIDERNEIAGSCMGIAQLDVGMRTDLMETCPKDLGIMMVLRSMSPTVVFSSSFFPTASRDIKISSIISAMPEAIRQSISESPERHEVDTTLPPIASQTERRFTEKGSRSK